MYRTCWVNLGWFALYLFGAVSPCLAEITLDDSLGRPAEQSIPKTGDEFTIRADMGQQKDNNLFHSFGEFNLKAGEIATFNDSGANGLIDHIFARITGGDSNIDGTLRTQFSNTRPDLYLINPEGIMFGPNAKLDVQGSFHASTSDFIQLEDDVRFSAIPEPESDKLLSSAPPSAFGFLETNKKTIEISGSDLRVQEGRSLSIIADKALVLNGKLDAPNGHINIRQVAANDTLATNRLTQELSTSDSNEFTPPADFEAQDIYIRSGNLIIAGGAKVGQAGGDITMEVANLRLEEGGQLNSSSLSKSGTSAGNINIQARDSVNITGHLADSSIPGLVLVIPSQIQTNVALNNTDDKAGNIHVTSPVIHMQEGIITANAIGAGIPGEIHFETNKLTLQDDAVITTTSRGAQQGGHITIQAKDSILIDGTNSNINSVAHGDGNAGQVTISAQQLTLQKNGEISTAIEGNNSTGNAGDINIDVKRLLHLSDDSAITTSAQNSTGNGGDILIGQQIAPEIMILDKTSHITAQAKKGKGGNIHVLIDHFFGSPENINASSTLGIDGQVDVATVTSDVVTSIQKLPESYVDVTKLIETLCIPQTTEDGSSLVVAPRDGRLASPDGLLSSRLVKLEPNSTALPEKKFNDPPYQFTYSTLAECQSTN